MTSSSASPATRRHAEALVDRNGGGARAARSDAVAEKTRITHIDEGFDFLGWRIKRDRGRQGRPGIYTYPSKRGACVRQGEDQADHPHAATNQSLDQLLHRLNPVLRGWCAYFRSGVSSRTFHYLRHYTWRRVVGWLRRKHPQARTGAGCDATTSQAGGRPQRDGALQPGGGQHHPLPLPGARIPTPWTAGRIALARCDRLPRATATPDRQMTTGMPVESRMRGNSHVRFGGRRRADHRGQPRHRRLAADPTTRSSARRASTTPTARRSVTVTRTGR